MFFGQLKEYIDPALFYKKYLFVDAVEEGIIPEDFEVVTYNQDKLYREQFVSCISAVEEEYCVYISEDYILYDSVRTDLILQYADTLNENLNLSFIRFMKGGVVDRDFPLYSNYPNLHQMHHSLPYFYTNQAALWRTRDLEKIHVHGPNLHIANKDWENSFEYRATKTCQELDIQGAYCYHGEPKRGLYHYDTVVFPHISTALVKGKWNISDYPDKMKTLIKKYDINTDIRGVY
tara:strand:- start:8308 stop:9009 length:702 start_codon:yes stop_codon:yes gene_type:complete